MKVDVKLLGISGHTDVVMKVFDSLFFVAEGSWFDMYKENNSDTGFDLDHLNQVMQKIKYFELDVNEKVLEHLLSKNDIKEVVVNKDKTLGTKKEIIDKSGYKKIYHIRDENWYGDIYPTGGATLVFLEAIDSGIGGEVSYYVYASLCHAKDNYNKKVGVDTALSKQPIMKIKYKESQDETNCPLSMLKSLPIFDKYRPDYAGNWFDKDIIKNVLMKLTKQN